MSAGLSVFCFLANLPGPPSIRFQNMTFQLWSVNRRKCPDFDPYRDTIFHLYTRQNPEYSQRIILNDVDSLARSNIDFSLDTIIFFHGWLESHENDDAQSIKNGYLERGEYNVILVQNERLLAGPDYITAALNCNPIARYSASFIDFLVSKGLLLKKLHVIGLSLGGQIAGMTGQYVKSGRLPRITDPSSRHEKSLKLESLSLWLDTGHCIRHLLTDEVAEYTDLVWYYTEKKDLLGQALDPAGPLFNFNPINERIDPSDADFVDVIFTSSGLWGMKYGVGHANFWPNGGGKKQPGCSIPEVINRYGLSIPWLVFCSHFRSYQLYTETLRYPRIFPSQKCNSYTTYKLGYCRKQPVTAYMGIASRTGDKGDFYLDTGLVSINIG